MRVLGQATLGFSHSPHTFPTPTPQMLKRDLADLRLRMNEREAIYDNFTTQLFRCGSLAWA